METTLTLPYSGGQIEDQIEGNREADVGQSELRDGASMCAGNLLALRGSEIGFIGHLLHEKQQSAGNVGSHQTST